MKLKKLIYAFVFMIFVSNSLGATKGEEAQLRKAEIRLNTVLNSIIKTNSDEQIDELTAEISYDLTIHRDDKIAFKKIIKKYKDRYKIEANILNADLLFNIALHLKNKKKQENDEAYKIYIAEKKAEEIFAEMETYVPLETEAEETLNALLRIKNDQEDKKNKALQEKAEDEVIMIGQGKRKYDTNESENPSKKQKLVDREIDNKENTLALEGRTTKYKNAKEIKDFIMYAEIDADENETQAIIKTINSALDEHSDTTQEQHRKKVLRDFLLQPSPYINPASLIKGQQFLIEMRKNIIFSCLKNILNIKENEEQIFKFTGKNQKIFKHFLRKDKPFILIN